MKLVILITGSPYSSQAPYSALQYCKAAIAAGHEIYRVFLYQDGIQLSNRLATPPQDEINIFNEWTDFIEANSIDAVTCIAAAARRGVIDQNEAERHNKDSYNIHSAFELSGLGQLVEANIQADRLITFGA
ncbi:MAG: sulfurtransferase complex subunit TusD [Oleiphilaceae bacterium]|nr:sulfurtransferase complex subunit TusD [Oleiphilaceae bacterium]